MHGTGHALCGAAPDSSHTVLGVSSFCRRLCLDVIDAMAHGEIFPIALSRSSTYEVSATRPVPMAYLRQHIQSSQRKTLVLL
jgi:hypothetical protein